MGFYQKTCISDIEAPFCICLCDISFNSTLSDLTEPVDVYSDWIDACESANG